MTLRYRWHPSWWRTTTWPEFRLLVRLMNEGHVPDPDLDDPDALLAGETGTPQRHYGRPPSTREIDLLLQAHDGKLVTPTVPGG